MQALSLSTNQKQETTCAEKLYRMLMLDWRLKKNYKLKVRVGAETTTVYLKYHADELT